MPELRRGYTLVPTIKRLDRYRLVLILDAVNHYLTVFLELPHDVAHVFNAILVGEHRALVDDLVDPDGRNVSVFLAQVSIGPFGAVTRKTLPPITVFASHYSLQLIQTVN